MSLINASIIGAVKLDLRELPPFPLLSSTCIPSLLSSLSFVSSKLEDLLFDIIPSGSSCTACTKQDGGSIINTR